MPVQDRTNEFRSCVESIRSRSSLPRGADAKQRLLRDGKTTTKSEFSRMASTIGKDISSTTIKLGKLAQRTHTSSVSRAIIHAHSLQSQNGKPCLTIGLLRLACVRPMCFCLWCIQFSIGTHLHNQTRHCEYQQANSGAAVLREAAECARVQVGRRKAARRAQPQRRDASSEQAGEHEHDFQGCPRSANAGKPDPHDAWYLTDERRRT